MKKSFLYFGFLCLGICMGSVSLLAQTVQSKPAASGARENKEAAPQSEKKTVKPEATHTTTAKPAPQAASQPAKSSEHHAQPAATSTSSTKAAPASKSTQTTK